MSEKFLDPSKTNPEDIASQLRKPSGDAGIAMGNEMNKGNAHICKNAYDLVELRDKDNVLEIGMGNGIFVEEFISRASQVNYFGLDFSSTMVEESIKNNTSIIENKQATFLEASIEKIPFDDNYFDSIVTVNTLYFWPNPEANAKELLRVLKPGSKLIIGYRDRETLEQMKFTQFGFTKYDTSLVENLLSRAGFKIEKTHVLGEPDIDFGNVILKVKGYYTVVSK